MKQAKGDIFDRLLSGMTVGENSVVAAGALVARDVPDNTVVAGIPAKVIRGLG